MQDRKQEQYSSINGLRAFSAVGILFMHVRLENDFKIEGFLFNKIIPSFTHLTLLFMMISGFCMCCGYYEKIKENRISVTEFYSRRYQRIWPYFAILVVLDLLLGFSKEAALEAFADLTLVFALLPNFEMSVLGVGWTLGVIFLFYMLFPFFVFLLKDKKTAWITFAAAVLYQVACAAYFMDDVHVVDGFRVKLNFLYCAVYFVTGGLIYLYRESAAKLVAKYRYLLLVLCIAVWFGYYFVKLPATAYGLWYLVLFTLMLLYAIGTKGKLINNKVTGFLSDISMELYLCHFGVLRVARKLKLVYLFGDGALSYLFTSAVVLAGAVAFSVCAKRVLNSIMTKIQKGGMGNE